MKECRWDESIDQYVQGATVSHIPISYGETEIINLKYNYHKVNF